MRKQALQIKIDPEDYERLRIIADHDLRSVSNVAQKAIKQFLESEENEMLVLDAGKPVKRAGK